MNQLTRARRSSSCDVSGRKCTAEDACAHRRVVPGSAERGSLGVEERLSGPLDPGRHRLSNLVCRGVDQSRCRPRCLRDRSTLHARSRCRHHPGELAGLHRGLAIRIAAWAKR